MKNLKDFKQHLRVHKPKPFQTYELNSLGRTLDDDEKAYPLTVAIRNVGMEFIAESNQVTTILTRYTKDFKKRLEEAKKKVSVKEKQEAIQGIQSELTENLLNDESAYLAQIGVMIRIGRELLLKEAYKAWWRDEADAFEIKFVETEAEEDAINSPEGEEEYGENTMAVLISRVTDDELLDIGSSISEGERQDSSMIRPPANIPIQREEEAEDGTKKVVTGSVPANEIANFPTNLGQVTTQDIPE
jgi:hypothetical protein